MGDHANHAIKCQQQKIVTIFTCDYQTTKDGIIWELLVGQSSAMRTDTLRVRMLKYFQLTFPLSMTGVYANTINMRQWLVETLDNNM